MLAEGNPFVALRLATKYRCGAHEGLKKQTTATEATAEFRIVVADGGIMRLGLLWSSRVMESILIPC